MKIALGQLDFARGEIDEDRLVREMRCQFDDARLMLLALQVSIRNGQHLGI